MFLYALFSGYINLQKFKRLVFIHTDIHPLTTKNITPLPKDEVPVIIMEGNGNSS